VDAILISRCTSNSWSPSEQERSKGTRLPAVIDVTAAAVVKFSVDPAGKISKLLRADDLADVVPAS
jgi:hypothetical protein